MTSTTHDQVMDFHRTFDCAINDYPSQSLRQLRMELVREEFHELEDAMGTFENADGDYFTTIAYDRVETADALADLVYVIYGTAISLGIDLDAVLEEVHSSNMAKANPDGTVSYHPNGKVRKPEGWLPPDIAGVLDGAA